MSSVGIDLMVSCGWNLWCVVVFGRRGRHLSGLVMDVRVWSRVAVFDSRLCGLELGVALLWILHVELARRERERERTEREPFSS